MNIVRFRLKESIGSLSAGSGRIYYDREVEALRFYANFRGEDALILTEGKISVELPQKAVSRIHFKRALLWGGGSIVIRLRDGQRSNWFSFFQTEEIFLPIKKRDVEAAEEMIKEVKFDLFEDTLDEMLETTDDTLGY